MPPTSAAQVMSVLTSDATKVTRPSLSPSRWRMRLNTGCLAIAGDAAAHFTEHDDADGRQGEHPDQRVAEHRAGLGREHELADVDEAADRGHHPERQLKRIQGCPRSASARRRAREVRRRGIVGLREQAPRSPHRSGIGAGQRAERPSGAARAALVRMRRDISRGQPARGRLLIDQRPFGAERARLADIGRSAAGPLSSPRGAAEATPSDAPLRETATRVGPFPCAAATRRPFSDSVRKVIEKRSSSPGAMLCSQSCRASPDSR